MKFSHRVIEVKRLFPLTISRGTTARAKNLFVFVEKEGVSGCGEAAIGTGAPDDLYLQAPQMLEQLVQETSGRSFLEIWEEGFRREIPMAALAALDIALWDWMGMKTGLPLYRLFGLPKPAIPTSVTIGIEPKEVVRDRVPKVIEIAGAKALKIKLGSPQGQDHDREIFFTAKEAAEPYGVKLRADANGGWDVPRAIESMKWLAEGGCDYIEQPLAKGAEDELPFIFENRPMPIFVDESVQTSFDIPKIIGKCDGVNMKLMKTGGLTDGLRVLHACRALGLGTMIGCMSDSSIAIAAGAAVTGICDHIDLDNHFNLDPDPATGVDMIEGVVMPRDVPGHGAYLI